MRSHLARLRFMFVGATSLIALTVTLLAAPNFGSSVSAQSLRGEPKPGTVIHSSSCDQPPPQAEKDRATYTPAELERYGLPPRSPGEPFEKWAKIVRGVKTRICDGITTDTHRTVHLNSGYWAGNIADGWQAGETYTEADMDYYVPCLSGDMSYGHDESEWIGLGGGANDDPNTGNVIQTGTAWNGGRQQHWAFVENTNPLGDPKGSGQFEVFSVPCGAHMYAKVYNGNCMYIMRIDTGVAAKYCYGKSDVHTAEAIVERRGTGWYLANFGSVTFYGVGITAVRNGVSSYKPMDQLIHDYYEMYGCLNGSGTPTQGKIASVGPIVNDPGDPPYDQYTVSWLGPGIPSTC